MLSFAMGSLVMAVVVGILGFSGGAGSATPVALVVFYVFLAMFVASLFGMAIAAGREARRVV